MVETVYLFTAEDQFVELEKVISVFIYIYLQRAVERVCCQLIVVWECDNVVSKPFIYIVHLFGPMLAFVQGPLDTCMGVEICLFPAVCRVYVPVWVEYMRSREWRGGCKIIDEASVCTHNNHQCNEQYCVQWFQQESKYLFNPEIYILKKSPCIYSLELVRSALGNQVFSIAVIWLWW